MAFDHPNIYGPIDEYGVLQWYNAARVPARMKVTVDGVLMLERVRFDLDNEYCRKGGIWNSWRPMNKSGQYVYDIEIRRSGEA